MPIVTDDGIYTAELCAESKRYLSRLLVGKTGINPDVLAWDLLLTEKFNLNASIGTCQKNISKKDITDKLIEIETDYLPERLKPYDPEVRKQQAELRHKKRAGLSLILAIILPIIFFFALPALGGAAILVGVLSALIETGLLSYSGSAFVGEKLIDSEWHKEYFMQKEKWQQKISAINAFAETAVIPEEIAEQIANKSISTVQPIKQMPLQKTSKTLTTDVATQTVSNNFNIKLSINCKSSTFILKPSLESSEEKQTLPTIECITA